MVTIRLIHEQMSDQGADVVDALLYFIRDEMPVATVGIMLGAKIERHIDIVIVLAYFCQRLFLLKTCISFVLQLDLAELGSEDFVQIS